MSVSVTPAWGARRPGPRTTAASAAQALSVAATRSTLIAIAWLLWTTDRPLWQVAVTAGAFAVAYLLLRPIGAAFAGRASLRSVAVTMDVASAVGLAAVTWVYVSRPEYLAVPMAVLGALRGVGDAAVTGLRHATEDLVDPTRRRRPGRMFLAAVGALLLGGAAGYFVVRVGPAGLLWLPTMAWCAAAAVVGWSVPRPRRVARGSVPFHTVALAGSVDPDDPDDDGYPTTIEAVGPAPVPAGVPRRNPARSYLGLLRDPGVLAVALTLALAELCGQAAAGLLVPSWLRDLLHTRDLLPLTGGALLLGILAGRLVLARASGPVTQAALLLGFAGGAVPGILALHVSGYGWAVAAIAYVVGIALASVDPTADALLDQVLPGERARAQAIVTTVAYLGVVGGAVLATWLVGWASFAVATAVGGGLVLLAVLIPMGAYRSSYPPVDGRVATLDDAASLGVTLAYSYGNWTVQVLRGRRVFARKHVVRPTDALSVVEILDVPEVRAEIEQMVASDRAVAERHAQRLRDELSDVDNRITAMGEVVELTEFRRASQG